MDLTKYLVSEVMQSMEQRLESLRRFYPEAKAEDWRLEVAGQRVQIIKKDPKKRRHPAIRYRTGRGQGRFPGGTARRFARCLGDRFDHA